MPEDIPEELGSQPDYISEAPIPPQKDSGENHSEIKFPDKFYTAEWIFAIVSTGITFGWSVSGFPSNIILACACWAVTTFVVLHFFWSWSKKWPIQWMRFLITFAAPILILIFSWNPIKNQYHKQHSPPQATATDIYAKHGSDAIDALKDAMATATNQNDLPLVAAYADREMLMQERDNISKSYTVINDDDKTPKDLEAELEHDLELKTNQDLLTSNQLEINKINQKKEDERQASLAAKDKSDLERWQNQTDQALLELKKNISEELEPTFNHVVTRLNNSLKSLSKSSGFQIKTDIGDEPNFYNSNFIQNGIISESTNFISLGTNSAWQFEISVKTSEITSQLSRSIDGMEIFFTRHYYAKIEIKSFSKDGESLLSITPTNIWDSNSGPVGLMGIRGIRKYPNVSIKLIVPDGVNIDANLPAESCKGAIDNAINHLIEAQMRESELTLK